MAAEQHVDTAGQLAAAGRGVGEVLDGVVDQRQAEAVEPLAALGGQPAHLIARQAELPGVVAVAREPRGVEADHVDRKREPGDGDRLAVAEVRVRRTRTGDERRAPERVADPAAIVSLPFEDGVAEPLVEASRRLAAGHPGRQRALVVVVEAAEGLPRRLRDLARGVVIAGDDEEALARHAHAGEQRVDEGGEHGVLGRAAREGEVTREADEVDRAGRCDVGEVLLPGLAENQLPAPGIPVPRRIHDVEVGDVQDAQPAHPGQVRGSGRARPRASPARALSHLRPRIERPAISTPTSAGGSGGPTASRRPETVGRGYANRRRLSRRGRAGSYVRPRTRERRDRAHAHDEGLRATVLTMG